MTPGIFAPVCRNRSKYTSPPRTLKAPVGVWFSCFTHKVQPARALSFGQAYCGVGGKTLCTRAKARSRSVRSNADSRECTATLRFDGLIMPLLRRAGGAYAVAMRDHLQRRRVAAYFAAGALFAAAAVAPRGAMARIHNCENASLLAEDGERLYRVARRVLPAGQELRLA